MLALIPLSSMAMVMADLICYDVEAVRSLVAGDESLKSIANTGLDPITIDHGAFNNTKPMVIAGTSIDLSKDN